MLCACVYHTEHGEKKEEDLRTKIVEKHGQSPEILMFLCPLCNQEVVIKKFTAHGTVANLPGRGLKRKIDERLQWRIVWMVDKRTLINFQTNSSWPSDTGYNNVSSHLPPSEWNGSRRPRRTPLLTKRHKKARLEFAKTYSTWGSKNPSGRMSCGQMRPK